MPSQSSVNLNMFILLFLLCACSARVTETSPTITTIPSIPPSPTANSVQITAMSAPPTPPIAGTSTPQPTRSATPGVTMTPLPTDVQILPDPVEYTWQVLADGLNQPVGLDSSQDGSGRLFVIEQAGLIWILEDGKLLPDPFLDLRDRVRTEGSATAGLLGLAFHPNHAVNGYFYIHYTDSQGASVIARYQTSQGADVADPTSELRLMEINFPIGEHKGGDLAFGPDGYLYISVGDGGAAGYGDQEENAQNPSTLLGSILRVDVDRAEPYGIPEDNPFISGGGLPEVWAYGLRNPWRFTFDRLNGDLYISDVGENRWEEINYLPASSPGGLNFGWNYLEGTSTYKNQPPATLKLVDPVATYDHSVGCSVTGGVVYRGATLPEWYGVYIYGDFCLGNVWGLLQKADGSWENELMHKIQGFITSFGQDEGGEVYLVDLIGRIYKLIRKQPQ